MVQWVSAKKCGWGNSAGWRVARVAIDKNLYEDFDILSFSETPLPNRTYLQSKFYLDL